jgi:hypothetical protein
MAPVGNEYEERGGGIAFFPVDQTANWDVIVASLAREHFRHPLGPAVQLGIATLDTETLARQCRSFGGCFWQGGEARGAD